MLVRRSGALVLPEKVVLNGVWRSLRFSNPLTYTNYLGSQSLNKALLDNKNSPTIVGHEIIEGSQCAKIKISRSNKSHTLLWIDKEHGFLLRKLNQYRHVNDKEILGNGSVRRVELI